MINGLSNAASMADTTTTTRRESLTDFYLAFSQLDSFFLLSALSSFLSLPLSLLSLSFCALAFVVVCSLISSIYTIYSFRRVKYPFSSADSQTGVAASRNKKEE